MKSTKKPILRVLDGECITPPPVWLMRQAGRYLPEYRELRSRSAGFLEFCHTPELAVEATLQPLRRFAMDGAILFSDILVVPDALGQPVAFREGEGPVLEPLASLGGVDRLRRQGFLENLTAVFKTIGELKRKIPETTGLIGFAGAPWTVATYMVEGRGGTDFQATRRWAGEAKGEFKVLIDLLVDVTSLYLIEQIKSGAELVQLFDSWAGVLDDDAFRRWSVEPTAEIVARVKAAFPGVPIIGFPRGAGTRYRAYGEDTGVDGLGLDDTVSLDQAVDLQRDFTVQGNLGNAVLVAGGQAMEEAVAAILERLAGGPFIFNLGHGVLPQTPVANVGRLVEIVRDWRQ